MNGICRLCMAVSQPMVYELVEGCEILLKAKSCLSITVILNESLPNQVCLTCIDKLEEIHSYQEKVKDTQNIFSHFLNLGEEQLKNLYNNLKNGLREDIKTFENKENDNLNITTQNYSSDDIVKQSNFLGVEETYPETVLECSSEDDLSLSSIKIAKKQSTKRKIRLKANVSNIEKKSVDSATVINSHKNAAMAKNRLTEDLRHKCLTCYELFDTQLELLHHYNMKHGTKCDDYENTNLEKYTINDENVPITYKCKQCDKLYGNKRAINRHVMSHNKYRPFVCKMCGRTYKTASEITRHGRAHNGFKLDCSYGCGYSTVYRGALKEHERRHRTEFKYKCEKCNKGFQVKTWYEEHQNIHNNVKPFVCNICGLAFHLSRYLTAHRSGVHPQSSSLKRYVCVHCSLPCDSRNTLTEHLKEHGIKTSVLCDICGKTLSNSEQLKFHKRMHLGIKPYSCSTCNKSFTKKFYLSLHVLTHSGERAHACARCGKRYTQQGSLRRHMLKQHATGPAKCNKCEKSFKTPGQLSAHEKSCIKSIL